MVYKRFLSLIFVALYPFGSSKAIEDNPVQTSPASGECVAELKNSSCKKESYYAEPKKKKQEREPRKLKEKIGQELADFIKNMHKNIEKNAQICQIASEVLQELVEQDKNNKIINANSKELQECLKELEKDNCEQQDYLEKLDKTKKFLKSGCIN